ncbi:MAG: PAS domain S-box protein, partial [Bacillota bacterium]
MDNCHMEPGNDKYRLSIENFPDAFAYHRIVTDEKGIPVDYVFLEVNQNFEELTGLSQEDVLGRKVTEVLPSIKISNFDWITTYGKVAHTGESTKFEAYSKPLGRWYAVTAYSDEPGYFVAVFRDITESKKTEQALRESEAKYRNLVENINEVIYILDENASITYVSPSVEYISGYTPFELTKMRFTDIVHPDDLEGRMEQFFKIMSGDNAASEYRFITKDGRIAWVRTSARPVIKEGQVVGVQGVLTNITERKETEEKMRQSEERFQKMLSLIPDMVSIQDPDMNIIYSNWNGFALVPEDRRFLNTKCYRTYRGLDDICPDCQAVTVLQTKEAFQVDVELPDGRWVDLRVIPILDNDNNVELFVEWVREITEIKHTEQELRTQQKLLEGIIDGVSDVLCIQRPDHSIERYNQAGYDLYGMTAEEMKEKKCYELIGLERECEECATRKAVQTKGLVHIEKYVPELGAYLDCRSSPILDEDGNVTMVVEQFRDITERKKTEEALRYHYEFEKMVSEIASHFIRLPADQVDEGVHYALKECGEFFQVERSYIFLLSPDGQSINMTHEWHQKEVEPQINRLQSV